MSEGDGAMRLELSREQVAAREELTRFVQEHVVPFAGEWDRAGAVPLDVVDKLREHGYLGAPAPCEVGGGGMDPITYGLLTEQVGRGCSSVRSLLTVHDMVTLAVARWGSPEVKSEILPRLARGERLAALGLSEPGVGSDAAGVETLAVRDGSDYRVEGRKKWITFGEIADEILILARSEEGLIAFLIPSDTAGFTRRPLRSVVGTRASRLAELELDGCPVPAERRVGRPGFGLSHVVSTALDHGRYSVAWGAVGIAQACLDACSSYADSRHQGGARLNEHQLVLRKLTNMIATTRAARLLCYRAGYLRQTRDPGAIPETMIAKYYASRVAVDAANQAVHLHGAIGLSDELPLERFLRDAKVTEIIEGSSEIQQISIPKYPLQDI